MRPLVLVMGEAYRCQRSFKSFVYGELVAYASGTACSP